MEASTICFLDPDSSTMSGYPQISAGVWAFLEMSDPQACWPVCSLQPLVNSAIPIAIHVIAVGWDWIGGVSPHSFFFFFYFLDFFALLRAQQPTDVSCFMGTWCPVESVWKSIQKSCRKGRRNSHMIREFLGNPMSIYRLTNHVSVYINQSQTLIETFWEATNGPN